MKDIKEKIYFENLDGLRFFCFLSVFLFHSFYTESDAIKSSNLYQFIKFDLFGNGNIGVNFFFVLSGFLISYLLIKEKDRNGKINLKYFWFRRILRIWPLYFLCLFLGFIAFPFFKNFMGQQALETANPYYYFLFINNFDQIYNSTPDSSILGVLWSVAIEEQFYFFWPIVLSFFSLRYYWIPFIIIIITSLVFRSIYDNPIIHEMHTLSCIGDMAIGGIGAWLIIQSKDFKYQITKLSRLFLVILYSVFFLAFFFRDEVLYSTYYVRIFERILIAIIILFVILEQCYCENSFFKIKKIKFTTYLGGISYGLYCFHFLGILIAITITKYFSSNSGIWQVLILETIFALLLTIIISKISYIIYESPFLKLKEKFSFFTKK